MFLGFTDLSSYNQLLKPINNQENISEKSNSILQKEKLKENEAIITRIIDGDSLILINSSGKEETVRLLLIDSPEIVHPDKPEEKFAKEASDFAKNYLKQGQRVVLERGNPEKDNYGRTLGYIFLNGVNFNQLMVEEGYARIAYVYEPNTKYLNELKQAEKRARKKKLNIWSIPGYVTDKGFDMSVVK